MKRRILPKRLPKPQTMDAPEREYMRNLIRYQKAYSDLMKSGIINLFHDLEQTAKKELPQEFMDDVSWSAFNSAIREAKLIMGVPRFDANFEKSVKDLFASVQNRLKKLFPDSTLRKWSEAMVSHVNDVSKKNIRKVGGAVDIEIEPLMRDKELTPYFKNVVDENVGLIKSISQQKIPQFKNFLVNKITNDIHNKDFWSDIERYIDQNTMSVRAHAKLIARDQVNKLNGRISQYRQQQIGGTQYIWRTSGDERVREDHKELEGRRFKWDKTYEVNKDGTKKNGGKSKPGKSHDLNPGQDYQCRCTAEMVLDDVIE